jgi:hypothetical protein
VNNNIHPHMPGDVVGFEYFIPEAEKEKKKGNFINKSHGELDEINRSLQYTCAHLSSTELRPELKGERDMSARKSHFRGWMRDGGGSSCVNPVEGVGEKNNHTGGHASRISVWE